MVDLAVLQSVSYIAGALGVCVAAAYYVMTLKVAERNKKIQLSTLVTEKLANKEMMKDWLDLYRLEWKDAEDFYKKYDAAVRTDESDKVFLKRWSSWTIYDNLGYLLREGLVDEEIIFHSTGYTSIAFWSRFKPVIEYYRGREMGVNWLDNFEYLARRMWVAVRDSGGDWERFRGVFEPGFDSSAR